MLEDDRKTLDRRSSFSAMIRYHFSILEATKQRLLTFTPFVAKERYEEVERRKNAASVIGSDSAQALLEKVTSDA